MTKNGTNSLSTITGQLAPYSQDAEEATIGSVMINEDAFHSVALFLGAEDFYILRHSYIWEAFKRLAQQRIPLDFVTITDELSRMNRLKDIGGQAYLLHLVNSTPTSAHADAYGRLVQRAAVRRRLLIAADEIKALALDEELSAERVVGDAERRLMAVTNTSLEDDSETLASIVNRVMEGVEYRIEHPETPVGILTGFRDFDELTGGLQKTDLTIIAARPGMGKTSLMLNIALNAAKLGVHIGFASQEMNREQVVQRLLSMESGVNSQLIRMGRLSDTQYRSLLRAMSIVSNLPIFVDDANRLTPTKLRTKALRWMNNHGLDLIMVDYLQILSSGGAFGPNDRVAEVGYFARELKQLARELHLPVVAAAQLSRAVEQRQDKRPQLSDLRESGEIEQEADLVHFIYRDVVYNEATEFPNRADIITAKHRNGSIASTALHFEKSLTKFSDSRTQTIDLSQL